MERYLRSIFLNWSLSTDSRMCSRTLLRSSCGFGGAGTVFDAAAAGPLLQEVAGPSHEGLSGSDGGGSDSPSLTRAAQPSGRRATLEAATRTFAGCPDRPEVAGEGRSPSSAFTCSADKYGSPSHIAASRAAPLGVVSVVWSEAR